MTSMYRARLNEVLGGVPNAMGLPALLIAATCVLIAGCRDSHPEKTQPKQQVTYDDAMKRLVAEQKQLEWIEGKIKEIEANRDYEIRQIHSERDQLLNFSGSGKHTQEETQKGPKWLEDYGNDEERVYNSAKEELSPWLKKQAEQNERIKDATKAADNAAEVKDKN